VSGGKHVPDTYDAKPLERFEAAIWQIAGRKLSAREIDLIVIQFEKAVQRAVLADRADGRPPEVNVTPRRVAPW